MIEKRLKTNVKIRLTKSEIDLVFKERDKKDWQKLIETYNFLRDNLAQADDAHISPDYQRKFNYYYQVRRNAEWRAKFYELYFERAKVGSVDFAKVLHTLFEKTGKLEASFASKFAATIDPDLPIIDHHVLTYLGRKLPTKKSNARAADDAKRLAIVIELHRDMKECFDSFLKNNPLGKYLIEKFAKEYPGAKMSKMKILDLILWQSGGKKTATQKKQ